MLASMKASFVFCLALVVSGLTACGGGSGGSGGGGSSGTSTAGAGGMADPVDCTASTPVFPTFDRACTTEADCFIAFHMINCCGTREALGLNSAEKQAFDDAESICSAQYPACGCAQGPTKTDEGSTANDDAMIQVQCASGQCMTYVP